MTVEYELKRLAGIARTVQQNVNVRNQRVQRKDQNNQAFRHAWGQALQGVVRSAFVTYKANLEGYELYAEVEEYPADGARALGAVALRIEPMAAHPAAKEEIKLVLSADLDSNRVSAVMVRFDGEEVELEKKGVTISEVTLPKVYSWLNKTLEQGGLGEQATLNQ